MSAANAKLAAEAWVQKFVGATEDLKGRVVRLVVFETEEDCLFFYPRRGLGWQQQVNTFASRTVRKRGAKVERTTLTAAGFEEWRRGNGGEDSESLRRRYAEQQQGLA